MSKPPPGIKRGPMSEAEHAEIERIAASLKRPTPGAIARRVNRHIGTVTWYMITHGLVERTLKYGRTEPYERGGRKIYPFCAAQDARLLELRTAGKLSGEIARLMTAEFGRPRNAHSVLVRLTMLAAYAEASVVATTGKTERIHDATF